MTQVELDKIQAMIEASITAVMTTQQAITPPSADEIEVVAQHQRSFGRVQAIQNALGDYQVQMLREQQAIAEEKDKVLGTTFHTTYFNLQQQNYAIRNAFGRRRR